MATNRWIKFPKPNPQARMRLFCLPFAGGGASTFQSWPKFLPADVEVAAYAFPGREVRINDELISNMEVLIEHLVDATLPYLDKPFAVFGHSMGAFISYELIKALEKKGFEPTCLLVSGCRAPHIAEEHQLYVLPDDELIEQLSTRYQAIPEMFLNDKAFMALLLPILRADIELIETYVYQKTSPLHCPIYAFGSVDDPETTTENIESWRGYSDHLSFTTKMFPGGHFYINSHQEYLLQTLSEIFKGD